MTADPAVQAAAEALASHYGDIGYTALHEDDATVAVAAARPIIEADVRERIAAEIKEACRVSSEPCSCTFAARIARGGAS